GEVVLTCVGCGGVAVRDHRRDRVTEPLHRPEAVEQPKKRGRRGDTVPDSFLLNDELALRELASNREALRIHGLEAHRWGQLPCALKEAGQVDAGGPIDGRGEVTPVRDGLLL